MNISTLLQAVNNPLTWLILGGVVLWHVSKWKTSVEHRLSGLEKSVDGLTEKTDGLTQKTNEIYGVIIKQFGRPVDEATSPVNLTEYGKSLFDRIDAGAIVDKYTARLLEETGDMNAYEVQEHCFVFCREQLLEDLETNDQGKVR